MIITFSRFKKKKLEASQDLIYLTYDFLIGTANKDLCKQFYMFGNILLIKSTWKYD